MSVFSDEFLDRCCVAILKLAKERDLKPTKAPNGEEWLDWYRNPEATEDAKQWQTVVRCCLDAMIPLVKDEGI